MNKIYSLLTFSLMSSLVVFGAVFSINKSLEGDNNAVLIAKVINRTNTPSVLALEKNSPKVLSSTTENKCKLIDLNENESISRLLDNNSIDSSYIYRTKLAEKLNIKAYRGSAMQNLQMVSIIKENKLCFDSSTGDLINE